MTDQPFNWELALAVIAAIYIIGLSATSIATGRSGYGKHALLRAERPRAFWTHVIGWGFATLLFIAAMAHKSVDGDAPDWPVGEAAFIILLAVSVAKALRTGEALDPSFSRAHEPRQYWVLVAAMAALIPLLIWLAANRFAS